MVRKVEDNSQRKALVKEAFSIRLKKSYRVASSGGNYYFLLLFKNSKSDNFIQFLLAPEYDPVKEVGEEVYDLEVLKQLESMPKTPAPMTQLLLHNSS